MKTPYHAAMKLLEAWPGIMHDCRETLGSELFYQAVVYHHLRSVGVPKRQLGMNVKMWISGPVAPLFRQLDEKKKEGFRGGFEPIPDVVMFSEGVNGDFRRRNNEQTLKCLSLVVEVKVSELAKARLTVGKVAADINKLAALRHECCHRGGNFYPVVMVLDTAPLAQERMTQYSYNKTKVIAEENRVGFLYCSPDVKYNSVQRHLQQHPTGPLALLAARDT